MDILNPLFLYPWKPICSHEFFDDGAEASKQCFDAGDVFFVGVEDDEADAQGGDDAAVDSEGHGDAASVFCDFFLFVGEFVVRVFVNVLVEGFHVR